MKKNSILVPLKLPKNSSPRNFLKRSNISNNYNSSNDYSLYTIDSKTKFFNYSNNKQLFTINVQKKANYLNNKFSGNLVLKTDDHYRFSSDIQSFRFDGVSDSENCKDNYIVNYRKNTKNHKFLNYQQNASKNTSNEIRNRDNHSFFESKHFICEDNFLSNKSNNNIIKINKEGKINLKINIENKENCNISNIISNRNVINTNNTNKSSSKH